MHLIKNGNKYYTVKNNNSNYGIYGNYYTIINGRLLWANPDIYLQSSGEQYIDTGYYLQSNNLKVKTKFTFDFSTYSSEKDILGSLGSNRFSIGTLSRKVFAYSRTGNTTNSLTSNTFNGIQTLDSEIIYDYDNSTKEIKIDGNTISGTNTIPIASTSNLLLLGPNLDRLFIGNIYYCKIYDNNSLVRHFVPVPKGLLIGNFVVPSNGMFDIVEQKFYENQGTGEFEIGGIPSDYMIEGDKMIWCNPDVYLSKSSGVPYFNSGIIPSNKTEYEFSYKQVSLGKVSRLYGYWNNGTSGSYNIGGPSLYGGVDSSYNHYAKYNDSTTFSKSESTMSSNTKHTISLKGGKYYFDGVEQGEVSTSTQFTCNGPMFVGNINIVPGGNNIVSNNGDLVYSWLCWNNSRLLQYLVPVPKNMLVKDKIAPSNCMFDLVTQKFFTNQGTGYFIYGKDN